MQDLNRRIAWLALIWLAYIAVCEAILTVLAAGGVIR